MSEEKLYSSIVLQLFFAFYNNTQHKHHVCVQISVEPILVVGFVYP
jgi:hypothetical protein